MTIAENVFQNYIGGKWQPAASGQTFPNYNPATGELLGHFPLSDQADVDAAVAAARKAFEKWRLVPAPKRGEILFRVGELLVRHKEELAQIMTQEMGKVLKETRGDVQEGIDMAYYMGGEGRRLFGYSVPVELPNKSGVAMRDPVGVVGCITPWNFPIAIPTWKMFPALVAGNTIVLKPAEDTPRSALRLVELLYEAGLPEGVVNIVFGPGNPTGEALIHHPDIAIISFTGSTETGRHVAVEAAKSLKRVSLEMGGKNAVIVMDDADLDLAVEGILWSAYGTTGQRCTACSRVIVHRAVQDQLLEKLVPRIEQLRLGDGLDEQVDVGPVINKKQLDKIHSYTEIGKSEGATLVTGGAIASQGGLARGHFYQPTLFKDVRADMRIAQEEIFGPTLSVIAVDSLEEAIEVNNNTKYGLSSAIYSQNINRVQQAMRDLTTGIIYVNSGTTGAEIQLPFGGVRGTGNGHREAGLAGLDVFTEWKVVYTDYSGKLQKAQIDTN
ncbi:aldehyde dehydrogenase family protein [Ktedonosporobacter rubrisoli]|uniref:Aldehyde dehydrogenase family protein n=1 Tax=Ktedonosporobacter rubrisoli TaxID=2509675 RepID=A0A4P6JXL1_KTERU|nr:aldehyde dehydrogenase family protein [Ktedonosporobacter rubrisoli]QBD80497.1 aldehyde dehydrogenase family protein [Ktedonosporobacter rubrisoli]